MCIRGKTVLSTVLYTAPWSLLSQTLHVKLANYPVRLCFHQIKLNLTKVISLMWVQAIIKKIDTVGDDENYICQAIDAGM